MLILRNVRLGLDTGFGDLAAICAKALKISKNEIKYCALKKRSIDARKKDSILFNCTFLVDINPDKERDIIGNGDAELYVEKQNPEPVVARDKGRLRPVVVGSGPAGLFAALTLANAGLRPILVERGRPVEQRIHDVNSFWKTGSFLENSNVQFGEGGAGTFSDGKLNTGIKDIRSEIVLKAFVEASAPPEILYEAEPHIGTDRLVDVVKNLRKKIISLGGEVLFEHKLVDIKFENCAVCAIMCETAAGNAEFACDTLILAIGHSARDTFERIYALNIPIERKPFAVGARIEHPQNLINKAQYGRFYDHPALGAANYKLAAHLPDGRGVYSFCMCPGGVVVAAASEKNSVVTNGMSNFSRDGQNANSAILVGVNPDDFPGNHPLAGVYFQREIEQKAFAFSGDYRAPAQLAGDFIAGRPSSSFGQVVPSYAPSVKMGSIGCCLPEFVTNAIRQGIQIFARKIKGFDCADAVLTVPETRSSSPVRMIRGENLQSALKGLYPCGEGAGYAGGIVSAAVDGIKCAEQIMRGD